MFTRAAAGFILLSIVGSACAQQTMYALSGNINPTLRRLDPSSGSVLQSLPVTGAEALFGGLACDAAGDLYSIDGYNDPLSDRTFRINRETGAGQVVGNTTFNWNFRMVHVHPATDVLYAARDNVLYTIDKTTGQATVVSNITGAGLGQITAMAINRQGQAFITNISGVTLFSLDLTTGQTAPVGTIGGASNWFNDLAFDENDILWGARRDGGVYTIDTQTAQETFQFFGIYTGLTFFIESSTCYPNCDGSTVEPILNIDDFTCFINEFAAAQSLPPQQQLSHYANCDGSTIAPVLNIDDFTCFINAFAVGCP